MTSRGRDARPARSGLVVHSPEVTRGLARAYGFPELVGHPTERVVWAAFTFLNSFLTIAILAGLAMIAGAPLVFPSLGPTAFLFFFSPRSPAAAPRHAIYGHAIGLVCGYASLWAFGLRHAPSAMAGDVDLPRVLAVALSLALTGAFMILARAVHPPAGATTLIVSLGIIAAPWHLVIIEGAVALLALQAIAINRHAGIDYPWWALREASE
jgi:CBS-domain-containing membrane protein